MTNFWRYNVSSENYEGWGVFFLDSHGTFSCVTDYGNYGYVWSNIGDSYPDIRYFLVKGHSKEDQYIANKLANGKKEYDGRATLENVKTIIKEKDFLEKDEEEYILTKYNNLYSEYDYHTWSTETNLNLFEEEVVEYVTPFQLQSFMKYLWPRFIEVMKKDLK